MRTAIAALLLATATLAHADQIGLKDLTPGGFNYRDPWPKNVAHFFGQYQFGLRNLAGANIVDGQVIWSPFTIFGDDHFDITLGLDSAMVDWNLDGTGFNLRFVLVEDQDFNAHLYRTELFEQFLGDGDVSFDGFIPQGIIFAGYRGRVPDGGSTIMLMGIGVLIIFGLRRYGTTH